MLEDKTITVKHTILPDDVPLTESEKQLATEHDRKLFTRNNIYNEIVPRISPEELEFYKLRRKVKRLEKQTKEKPRPLTDKEEELMINYSESKHKKGPFTEIRVRATKKYAEVIKNLELIPTKEECKAGHRISWLKERPKRRKVGNVWVVAENDRQ